MIILKRDQRQSQQGGRRMKLKQAITGHALLFMGGTLVLPAIIYVFVAMTEPFFLLLVGGYLIWAAVKEEA